ncbi:alpha-amylase family glycosyl hydrolase [Candidatus Thiosymbion oneisti]|uniref:alpha-amylase family glycosyl hydrolase n=1 Tax=Candidatus Thiosymbion oneisti TaxID=589554 RepID=UPI000ADCED64|nr:alpha-amylase family glycosyl hydrolase [Candidatus Thiosymbion oneisti]
MSLTVHFKRPVGWGEAINVHHWNTAPGDAPTTWPGVPMTAEGNDWFAFTWQGADAADMVFNDGAGRQTGNLRRERDGWFFTGNTWYDENPERPQIPVVRASLRGGLYNRAQQVILEGSNDDDSFFYTLDGTEPTTASPRYAGPISVDRTATLAVIGVNSAGEQGQIRTFTYTIDPNADLERPVITSSHDSGTHADPIDAVFTVRDNRPAPITAYFTLDGSEPGLSASVYVAGNAADGLAGPAIPITATTSVRFLVVDGAGNRTRRSFYFNIGPSVAPGDFRAETIYFLITTRFYDGDPSNNYFCRDRIRFNLQTGEAEDPHWRGDFRGLIQRLDYLRDLGFTAIWITPPVENRSGLDYHGYHAYDWTRIDPRLESPDATYQDLINEAHARGIKIIQDVVINHSSQYGIRGQVWIDHLPIKYYVPQGSQQGRIDNGPYQGNLGDYTHPARADNDNPVAPAWFRERQERDPQGTEPLTDPLTGARVPNPGYNPNRFFGIDATRLDPTWYHQEGFVMGGDWESQWPLQSRHMAGDCIDLNTENQVVKDYLIGAINRYLDMGVDALRIDTVKHIERGNLLEYVNAWKAHKPGLFVFGENLVKGTGWGDLFGDDNGPSTIRPWWYTRLGGDPRNPNSGGDSGFSVLDFGLFSTFRDNVSRGHYGGIGGILANDWVYGDATQLVTFLQNHDVGPDNDFRFRFQGDDWMAAAAYNLLWTIRGIPCLYQGEEIAFMRAAPQDIISNNDTLETTGRAYFGDQLTDERLPETQSHSLYRHIRRLNQIRRAIPALQKAPMSRVGEWGSGMSFVRDHNNGESYCVVGLAVGSDQNISVGNVRNGTYRDAVTGNELRIGGGTISFQVRANSAGIYVLNGPGRIGEEGPYLR